MTGRYDLTPVMPEMIQTATKLCANHPLRAYDALQLAAGLAVWELLVAAGDTLVFVSADDALLAAAKREGLTVENPFWHTDLDL
ncbi:MAG: hypothetical protein HYX94_10335 [Chloroflexi bacterium]|nr:hypothetical protein [Chloroflexota bacterium]